VRTRGGSRADSGCPVWPGRQIFVCGIRRPVGSTSSAAGGFAVSTAAAALLRITARFMESARLLRTAAHPFGDAI